eukprot:CAMPEP_0194069766 /NCGR_PEP_ID=MMETSP0009_2-20130614/87816_1 /TAXON_ID=210454 /ORGANISM="Grammatophora oceanica, Strain CCMP 410" /LENGTH=1214 /DNA_ID=CAMNT_0038722985 /DNA_START=712 /DNA_END=4356 /DNA_ORIENTATION=+
MNDRLEIIGRLLPVWHTRWSHFKRSPRAHLLDLGLVLVGVLWWDVISGMGEFGMHPTTLGCCCNEALWGSNKQESKPRYHVKKPEEREREREREIKRQRAFIMSYDGSSDYVLMNDEEEEVDYKKSSSWFDFVSDGLTRNSVEKQDNSTGTCRSAAAAAAAAADHGCISSNNNSTRSSSRTVIILMLVAFLCFLTSVLHFCWLLFGDHHHHHQQQYALSASNLRQMTVRHGPILQAQEKLAALPSHSSFSTATTEQQTLPSWKESEASFLRNAADLERTIQMNKFVFVAYRHSDCSWSRRLGPEWYKLGEAVKKETSTASTSTSTSSTAELVMAHVDCADITSGDVCRAQNIRAFPTLRLYVNGIAITPDFRLDRTADVMMSYLKAHGVKLGRQEEEDIATAAMLAFDYSTIPANNAAAASFSEENSMDDDYPLPDEDSYEEVEDYSDRVEDASVRFEDTIYENPIRLKTVEDETFWDNGAYEDDWFLPREEEGSLEDQVGAHSDEDKEEEQETTMHSGTGEPSETNALERAWEASDAVFIHTPHDFERALRMRKYVFVAFRASWCTYCQRLGQTWYDLGMALEESENVVLAHVDCAGSGMQVCREQEIYSYPTLRLYVDGIAISPDYGLDRTVAAFSSYLKAHGARFGFSEEETNEQLTTPTTSSSSVLVIDDDDDDMSSSSDILDTDDDYNDDIVYDYPTDDSADDYYNIDSSDTDEQYIPRSAMKYRSTETSAEEMPPLLREKMTVVASRDADTWSANDESNANTESNPAEESSNMNLASVAGHSNDDAYWYIRDSGTQEGAEEPTSPEVKSLLRGEIVAPLESKSISARPALERKEMEKPAQISSDSTPSWEAADSLLLKTTQDLESTLQTSKYVFVAYGAPWCHWSRKLGPVWYELSMAMTERENIVLAHVECSDTNTQLICRGGDDLGWISAFPTLRLYVDGRAVRPDYKQSRSVCAMVSYLLAQGAKFGYAHGADGGEQLDRELATDHNSVSSSSDTDHTFDVVDDDDFTYIEDYLASKLAESIPQEESPLLREEKSSAAEMSADGADKLFGQVFSEGLPNREEEAEEGEDTQIIQIGPAEHSLHVSTQLHGNDFVPGATLWKYEYAFVLFCDSRSAPCREMESVWKELGSSLQMSNDYNDHTMRLGHVDCTTEGTLCQNDQNIVAIPTIRLYRGQLFSEDYRGDDGMNVRSVLEFLQDHTARLAIV